MNIILAVRNNIADAIADKEAEIAKCEAPLEAFRAELHTLEDLRAVVFRSALPAVVGEIDGGVAA